MDATFTFDVDPVASIVRVTMSGFFGADDVENFARLRDEAHRRLACGDNRHLTLVDIRNMRIQSRETVEAFSCMLGDPRTVSRAIAFVVAPGLARSQIRRAASGRHAAFFMSVEEAEAWLDQASDGPGEPGNPFARGACA